MALKRLDKLPKRNVTVDELLHSDEIADLLKDCYDNRHEIDQFVLIYTDHKSVIHNFWHGSNERLVFALEQAKMKIIFPVDETEGE